MRNLILKKQIKFFYCLIKKSSIIYDIIILRVVIIMKIDMLEDYELTNDFFNNHCIDDVLWFSYAEAGAMGIPGNIEAVVKSNDKEIDIYSNS